jgi:hypothetical protein
MHPLRGGASTMSRDQILGQLLADQKTMHEDLLEVKRDVKALNEFRWMWLGKMGAYAGIIATLATVVTEYILYKHGG